jgi:sigma-54 dependent transcriptional regulator, acetoin dehydrogenase operon transcriptional activator AcoR
MTLNEILVRDVKKMVGGIGPNQKGNIHPLIMQEIEKNLIEIVLEETKYNLLLASRILGIGRSTLYRKIDKLKIELK